MTRVNKYAQAVTLVGLGVFLATGMALRAQTITLTSPTTATEYADGDDFATEVVGNPWDMTELRDIAWDVNFWQPSVADGVWSGTYLKSGAYFFPLFRGYSTPTWRQYDSLYDKGTPYGTINPITASTFTKLSIRMSLQKADRSNIFLYWTKDPTYSEFEGTTSTRGSLGFPDSEWSYSGTEAYASGYRIYDLDMTGNNFFDERRTDMFDALTSSGTWADKVYGLLINPSASAGANTIVSVDWIRLYNPNTSPTCTITWTTAGTTAADFVRVYVDSDNSGNDGDLFISGVENDGQYKLPTAALPPGTYYVYLQLCRRGATIQSLGYSAYTGKITIQATPSLEFSAPCFTNGQDYAETVLGDAWDMSSASDLRTYYHLSSLSFSGGWLLGNASPPAVGATESDAQIWMNLKQGGTRMPIDTTKYRYLTFSMQVAETGYTNMFDRIRRGWVSRTIWGGSDDLAADGSYTKDIPLLEGLHTYHLDLWDGVLLEPVSRIPTVKQAGWKAIGSANLFRFDPIEVPQTTAFYIDDIKLCAMDKPTDGAFTVKWNVADADSASVTVDLYYGWTNAAGTYADIGTIGTTTHTPGPGSITWDTSGLTSRDYFVRAEVTDGANTLSRRSKTPVRVLTVPGATTAVWPTNEISDASAGFWWTEVLGAEWYHLYVLKDGVYYTDTWTQNRYWTPSSALAQGSYQWWVQTWGTGGWGAWSSTAAFLLTQAPTGLSPSGAISDTQPTFSWSETGGASWFHVYIMKDNAYYYDLWLEGTSWTPTWCLAPGSYQWWVGPWITANGDYGTWSSGAAFTVAGETPTITSPSGTITGSGTEFSWSSVSGATWFHVYIMKDNAYYYDLWLEGTTWTPTWSLGSGSYQYWVGPWLTSAYSYGCWSTAGTFTVP